MFRWPYASTYIQYIHTPFFFISLSAFLLVWTTIHPSHRLSSGYATFRDVTTYTRKTKVAWIREPFGPLNATCPWFLHACSSSRSPSEVAYYRTKSQECILTSCTIIKEEETKEVRVTGSADIPATQTHVLTLGLSEHIRKAVSCLAPKSIHPVKIGSAQRRNRNAFNFTVIVVEKG